MVAEPVKIRIFRIFIFRKMAQAVDSFLNLCIVGAGDDDGGKKRQRRRVFHFLQFLRRPCRREGVRFHVVFYHFRCGYPPIRVVNALHLTGSDFHQIYRRFLAVHFFRSVFRPDDFVAVFVQRIIQAEVKCASGQSQRAGDDEAVHGNKPAVFAGNIVGILRQVNL